MQRSGHNHSRILREERLESSSHIKEVLVFSFHYTILLRCFHTTSLMYYAFGVKEIPHLEFYPNITPKQFDFFFELSFNHVVERLYALSGFR